MPAKTKPPLWLTALEPPLSALLLALPLPGVYLSKTEFDAANAGRSKAEVGDSSGRSTVGAFCGAVG